MATDTMERDAPGEHGHGGHASVKFYCLIGAILGVLTAMEVAAYYMDLGSFETPLLLALSAAKFALVVMFFMHLRFDPKVLSMLFLAGLGLGALVISSLLILFHVLPRYGM